MHPALEAIKEVTIGTPFEGELWLVGGAVRDELLGIAHNADFDIVLQGSSQELAQFLYRKRTSTMRPVTYERFGTALVHVRDTRIEIVTARRESYEAGSRKPHVEPATLRHDALRRDFTVNTLMRNLHSGELLDATGRGLDDLKNRVLQTPLDPVETFHDDPLRMLRAVRFRWKLGFEPAKGLYGAIKQEGHRLQIISCERIRDELFKMLLHPTVAHAMRDLMNLGLFEQFAPELPPMVGLDQGPYHHLDAWDHSLLVLENAVTLTEDWEAQVDVYENEVQTKWASPLYSLLRPNFPQEGDFGDDYVSRIQVLRLAALLHDVGKPQTRYEDHGRVRTTGHEEVGAQMAGEMLRRLKFPLKQVDEVCLLIKNHSRLGYGPPVSVPTARRIFRELGDLVPLLLILVQADRDAHKPDTKSPDLNLARAVFEQVMREAPREMLDSPLEGGEIMELLKLEPGPKIGMWKRFLTEQVLDGKIAPGDKAAAKAALLRAVAESSAS